MCDLVNNIDMVDPFSTSRVTLIGRVNMDIIGVDFGVYHLYLCTGSVLPKVGCRLPQIVRLRDQDTGTICWYSTCSKICLVRLQHFLETGPQSVSPCVASNSADKYPPKVC